MVIVHMCFVVSQFENLDVFEITGVSLVLVVIQKKKTLKTYFKYEMNNEIEWGNEEIWEESRKTLEKPREADWVESQKEF